MFDEKYRVMNDRMRPSDEAVKSALDSIKGCDAEASGKKNHAAWRKKWIVSIACVLCVCLILPVATVVISKISLGISMSKPWTFDYYSTSENRNGSVDGNKDEYSEIYKRIEASVPKITWTNLAEDLARNMLGMAVEDANNVAFDTPPAAPVEAPNSSNADFSETNTQVEGVDEADVVKTDGEYIYALNSESVSIIRADKGDSTVVSTIFVNELESHSNTARISFTSMYLFGDRLIILANERTEFDGSNIVDVPGYSSFLTVVYVCDISDRGDVKIDAVLCQDGSYTDSRMIGDRLILISKHSIRGSIEENRPETYVPCTYDNNGKGNITAPNDVYIMPEVNIGTEYYTYVTELDISNPESFTSELAILGYVGTVYCSEENLVLLRTLYATEEKEITYTVENGNPVITNGEGKKAVLQSGESKTELFLIPLNGEELTVSAHESVSGFPLNQFSIDEFNGNFRIVVTKDTSSIIVEEYQSGENEMQYAMPLESDTSNGLYVLDSELNTIGSIENIAPGERVYSVRFMGEVGYFVTFRETDPLFSVDLSDPENPVILGELKIPGFSEYLHPWGENMLLGFGKAADESNGAVDGLKLSMFDVSDPADVKEVSCTELGEYMYSTVSSNHKAILVSFEKNLIGFPAEGNYLIYSYDEDKGFLKEAEIKTEAYNWYNFTELRGLYIDDYIYIVNLENCNLTVIDISSFTLVANLNY